MRISCWWKGRLHCMRHFRNVRIVRRTRCRKNQPSFYSYCAECCVCGKTKYFNTPSLDSSGRVLKRGIDWIRTTELALTGEKGND